MSWPIFLAVQALFWIGFAAGCYITKQNEAGHG